MKEAEYEKIQAVRAVVNLQLRDGGDLEQFVAKCVTMLADLVPDLPKPVVKVEVKKVEPKKPEEPKPESKPEPKKEVVKKEDER